MRHHKCKCSEGAFVAGALLGGLIGAGAALLFAPQSGEKTRKQIKGEADKLKLKAKLAQLEAQEKMNEVKDNVEDAVSDVKNKAQTAAKNIGNDLKK
jgi:gas vesicle protein